MNLRNSSFLGPFAMACAAVVCVTDAASAAGDCAELGGLLQRAQTNFTDQSGQIVPPPVLRNAEFCSMARDVSGANGQHCAWGFDYRTSEAQAAFQMLTDRVVACFPTAHLIGGDQLVNHPDYFDQRQFQIDDLGVTVSLKDKGALQKTYVFLAVHGAGE